MLKSYISAVDEIRTQIHPVPQQVTTLDAQALKLTDGCKWCVSAPEAEKGPVKTAKDRLNAFLQEKCGNDCFAQDGKPVVLQFAQAPEEVAANKHEGYRLEISDAGITVTGFGESGLFYGVLSLLQLGALEEIPAVRVLDWPDNACRAFKQECRYGSNVMQKEDWLAMIDDVAAKKLNTLSIALYGCWTVQFDGKVAEYLYLPIKNYPQVNTPQTVRYYSPTEGRWIDYETLPPIFRENFFADLVRYAKDRAIDVIPGFNSLGHNTVFPSWLPEVAPKDENGNSVPSGFCTSSEETYKLLFSVYDQLIDECLLPNNVRSINIHLDEVYDEAGVNVHQGEFSFCNYYVHLMCANDVVVPAGKTVYINFNGENPAVVTVGEGAKLYAFDSSAPVGRQSNTTFNTTKLEPIFLAPNGVIYVAVPISDSAMATAAVEIKITGVSLRTHSAGIYYTATVNTHSSVAANLTAGIALNLDTVPGADFKTNSLYTAQTGFKLTSAGADLNGVLVNNILKADAATAERADRKICAVAYFEYAGETFLSESKSYSLTDLMELMDESFESFTAEQQARLKNFYNTYATQVGWDLPAMAAFVIPEKEV